MPLLDTAPKKGQKMSLNAFLEDNGELGLCNFADMS
jgi:hypothetical protein